MSSIDPTASATRFIERTEIGASARPEKVGRASSLAPDVLTSLGLFAGCVSLVSSTGGHFERAAVMIGVSILCDVADGLVALLQTPPVLLVLNMTVWRT
jgi:hypothetical protein